MNWIKRVMERGQPPEAAPYATTPRGYPFPLRSWPPDAAIDIQNLATAIDTDNAMDRRGEANHAVPSPPSGLYRIALGTSTILTGGMTLSGGCLVVPVAGIYTIDAWVYRAAIGGNSHEILLGNDSAVQFNGPSQASGAVMLNMTRTRRLTAGTKVGLWTSCAAAGVAITSSTLTVTFIHP